MCAATTATAPAGLLQHFPEMNPLCWKTSYSSAQCYRDTIKHKRKGICMFRSTFTDVTYSTVLLSLCLFAFLHTFCIYFHLWCQSWFAPVPQSHQGEIGGRPCGALLRRFQSTYGERAPSSSSPLWRIIDNEIKRRVTGGLCGTPRCSAADGRW